jgi:hypothetical protein
MVVRKFPKGAKKPKNTIFCIRSPLTLRGIFDKLPKVQIPRRGRVCHALMRKIAPTGGNFLRSKSGGVKALESDGTVFSVLSVYRLDNLCTGCAGMFFETGPDTHGTVYRKIGCRMGIRKTYTFWRKINGSEENDSHPSQGL